MASSSIVPPLLLALGLDQRAAVLRHVAGEDGLPPLGAPDEVVDDQVDPVFVALIFHVDSILSLDMEGKAQSQKTTG